MKNRQMRHYLVHGAKEANIARKLGLTVHQLRIKRLIHLCGGSRRIMDACGIEHYSGVTRWVTRGDIPEKHWPVLCFLTGGKIDVGDIAKIVHNSRRS